MTFDLKLDDCDEEYRKNYSGGLQELETYLYFGVQNQVLVKVKAFMSIAAIERSPQLPEDIFEDLRVLFQHKR